MKASPRAVRDAYIAAAQAWSHGPEEVFAAMADALVARCPIPVEGTTAVDLGTGSGVVARALARDGARVTLVDDAFDMLTLARPAAGGRAAIDDVRALPLRAACVDVACAGFVLNHLDRPGVALRDIVRAVRPGGAVLASTWARGEEHPVKAAAEEALLRRGWQRPAWYAHLKETTTPLTDTVEGLRRAAVSAGLDAADVSLVTVDLAGLPVDAMIAWRTNLPPNAPFVAALAPDQRAALIAEIRDRLGTPVAALRLQMVALSSRVAA